MKIRWLAQVAKELQGENEISGHNRLGRELDELLDAYVRASAVAEALDQGGLLAILDYHLTRTAHSHSETQALERLKTAMREWRDGQ